MIEQISVINFKLSVMNKIAEGLMLKMSLYECYHVTALFCLFVFFVRRFDRCDCFGQLQKYTKGYCGTIVINFFFLHVCFAMFLR